jgi:cell division protein FtsB
MMPANRPSVTMLIYWCGCLLLGTTFIFAAMQGNYGLFRRAEVLAESRALQAELDMLTARVARMENLTRRMSDDYLDLDLLDEQARSVLGLLRSDEIVVR